MPTFSVPDWSFFFLKIHFWEDQFKNNSAKHICAAMPLAISIDNFIDAHRSNLSIEFCGKLAIARCILEAESCSKLFVSRDYRSINFQGIENTWYCAFFQLLTENRDKSELIARFSKVAIVCFNYDRCIEHFLHSALQTYYGICSIEAAEILSSLEIFHPYGSVGKLPWQNFQGSNIKYGLNPNVENLIQISKNLRTFTEGVDSQTSDIQKIRNTIASAQSIGFLGFAFHQLNLQLLFQDTPKLEPCQSVFATAYGISDSDVREIKTKLKNFAEIENPIIRNDLTCKNLFTEYSRSIPLALNKVS